MSPSFAAEELKPLGQAGPPVVFAPEELKPLPNGGQAGPVVFEANQLKPLPASTPGVSGPTPGATVDLGGPVSAYANGFNAYPVGFKGLDLGPSANAVLLPPAASPRAPDPQEGLPPNVVEIEGTYYRPLPGGSLLPVGEKGLIQPMYDPIELVADGLTGGLTGVARLAGRSVLGLATRQGLGDLVRQGFRPAARAALSGAARDAGFGALAGGTMEAVDQGTGSQVGAALAGMGAPVVAAVGPMAVRRGLAKIADNAAGSVGQAVARAAGNEGWQASQSKLAQRFGTLSEAIGSEAFGALSRADAEQALAATRVAAETGEYTLRPWVQNLLQGVPWLRDDRALIIGQSLRDIVNRIPGVGEALAGRLGLTSDQLRRLTDIGEAIPANPLDEAGNLRLGVWRKYKDANGNLVEGWANGLDPEKARGAVASLSPVEGKFLMAYVEPAEGFHLPPRLAPVGQVPGDGVDLGRWALVQVARRTGMTPEDLAANYATQGRHAFVAGFGSGDDTARVMATRAADHLEDDISRYLQPFRYQEPDAQALADAAATPGPFGPIFTGFVNRPEEAIAHLMKLRTGEAVGVLSRPETGAVDLVWGEGGPKGFGLAHILEKHGEEVVREIPRLFANGDVIQMPKRPGRLYVETPEHMAVIRLDWDGQEKRWLVTAYDKNAPHPNRTSSLVGQGGESTPSPREGLNSIVEPAAGEVKPGPGQKAMDQAAGQAGDLGNLLPDDSGGPAPRLAGQVGRAAADWRAPGAVDEGTVFLPYTPRKPGEKFGGISREVNFRRAVEHGILQPGQHLEGYVTHMLPLREMRLAEQAARAEHESRLGANAPELNLSRMEPDFAKTRIGNGERPRLDQAITTYRTDLEKAISHNNLLRWIGQNLVRPMPISDGTAWRNTGREVPEGYWKSGKTPRERDQSLLGGPDYRPRKNAKGEWTIHEQYHPAKQPHQLEPEELLRRETEYSPWAGKDVTRTMPETVVDVPEDIAKALGVAKGYYRIPSAFAERFNLLTGRIRQGKLDTPLEGLATIARDLARYWKVNVLAAPGTVATNAISGGLQYGAKTMGDLLRHGFSNPRRVLDDFSAPLHALRPSMIEAVPAEILGGNVATQFGREASEFYKGVSARLAAGETVGLPTRAAAAVSEYLLKTLNFMLKPFGAVENYWKRSLYLSETMDWARRESKRLAAQGEQVRPQDLVASVFQQRPDLHREVMQGAVDRFGMDYDNVPTWLKRFRESLVGAATAPFPVYAYKYARTIGSHLNAFNPLNRGLAPRERAARAAELIIPLSAYAATRRYAAGGDSQVEADRERFEADYGDSGIKPDYPKLGGRDHVTSYRDYSPDPRDLAGRPSQGWDKEVFLRTAKYPYVNLSHALSGWEEAKDFGDEFKSTGPLVPLIMNLLEADMRQGPRDYPGQLGRLVSELIPAHRMVEFLAAVNDDFRKRAPKGFWEQIMLKFPGAREYLHQPDDKWAAKLAQEERGPEWLKFLAGVNLRTVDVASAKEATSEAVARASERGLKDSQRLAFYSARTGLAPEVLEPHLAKIRQAETNGLLLYRQVERTFFGQALKAGVNVLDPGQASAVNQAKRKVGREVVTHGLGARTQAQADQGARLLFGLTWINQNLGNAGGVGSGR